MGGYREGGRGLGGGERRRGRVASLGCNLSWGEVINLFSLTLVLICMMCLFV